MESLSTGCTLLKDFLGLHEVAVDLVSCQVVVGIAQIIWRCVLVLALQVLGSQQLTVCQPHIGEAHFSSSRSIILWVMVYRRKQAGVLLKIPATAPLFEGSFVWCMLVRGSV